MKDLLFQPLLARVLDNEWFMSLTHGP